MSSLPTPPKTPAQILAELYPNQVDGILIPNQRIANDGSGDTLLGSGVNEYRLIKPRVGPGIQPLSAYSPKSANSRYTREEQQAERSWIPEGIIGAGIRQKVEQNPGKFDFTEDDIDLKDTMLGIKPIDLNNRAYDLERIRLQSIYGNQLRDAKIPAVLHGELEPDIIRKLEKVNLGKENARTDKRQYTKDLNTANREIGQLQQQRMAAAIGEARILRRSYDDRVAKIEDNAYREKAAEIAQQNLIADREGQIALAEHANKIAYQQHQENLAFKRDQWEEKTRQYNDNKMGNKVDLGIAALATIFGGLFA